MPTVVETYTVATEGIGRKDFTNSVERSLTSTPTGPLRQALSWTCFTLFLPVGAYPYYYIAIWPLPQEDGSWAFEASTILQSYFNVSISIRKNALVGVSLLRFASLGDYYIFNVAEYFPRVFGYGHAEITFTDGIPTTPGSVYGVLFGFWTGAILDWVNVAVYGLVSDLTRPWM